MKNLIKIKWGIPLFLTLIFFSACNLELQKEYDFDENARINEPSAPFDMTIWEFMNEQSDFDLMVQAVQLAGLENIFNEGEDDKTVLLLRQKAMQQFLNDQDATSLSEIPVQTLQNFLFYHVITTRFKQHDLNSQEDVQFHSLLEGPNGRINIWKWRRYEEIQINRNGSPDKPSTAKSASVFLHNYEFTNGVGHQMEKYVQWAPF